MVFIEGIKIFQVVLAIIILFIIILSLIENYKLKRMKERLKIEQENTENIKFILSKYLNQDLHD